MCFILKTFWQFHAIWQCIIQDWWIVNIFELEISVFFKVELNCIILICFKMIFAITAKCSTVNLNS